MLFTRLLSIILRTAQWVFAAIVLGLSAYFVYQRSRYHVGPLGRLIFAIIWSSLSILFAVIWAIPTSSSITGYTSDFIFTAGWAAVFGLLVSWFNDRGCGSAWAWSGVSFSRNNSCGQWRAAQAFSFLSMILWLATAILGILTVHRLKGRAAGRGSRV
ncbi:hypothetical protein AA0113_g6418 [Alternaria arborescens]|uniref:MARVEL domain-containing protein n=1 Tax=Alternaria arborescens TaxID=156630 RepID=A0A4Q4RWS9_9PLEO|nr:hypothetical protein AA0111_g4832 [Alternaria arborescens]RYN37774.1 hypothetical protein AA0112_g4194 [Alternaria arborescens]RYO31769.1 hypothetical protein AA0111_g4832 [Alternaria arborescens]RYO61820.1 hypothetical protein AA0113_g6418 [Alternaria arborescens]